MIFCTEIYLHILDNEFCQTEKFSQQSLDLVWISLNQSLKCSLSELVSVVQQDRTTHVFLHSVRIKRTFCKTSLSSPLPLFSLIQNLNVKFHIRALWEIPNFDLLLLSSLSPGLWWFIFSPLSLILLNSIKKMYFLN